MFITVGFTLIVFVSVTRDDFPPHIVRLRDAIPMARKDKDQLSRFLVQTFNKEMLVLAYSISYYANVFPISFFGPTFVKLKLMTITNKFKIRSG